VMLGMSDTIREGRADTATTTPVASRRGRSNPEVRPRSRFPDI